MSYSGNDVPGELVAALAEGLGLAAVLVAAARAAGVRVHPVLAIVLGVSLAVVVLAAMERYDRYGYGPG